MPPLYLPLVLLAAVVGMSVAVFAWLHRDQPGARPLTVFVVAASFWAVAEGMGLATGGLGSLRFWHRVGLTLSAVVPVAWLVTVLEYTGQQRWLTRRRLALLLVEPAVFTVLVWTNGGSGLHELVWTAGSRGFVEEYSTFVMDFGLGFWAHQVYSYLLVTAGGFLLLGTIFRTRDLYRSQSTALLLAIALPMIGNALYVFRVLPAGVDPTGVSWVLAGLVLTGAMLRTHLLALSPATRDLGREEMLTELDDRVFILDDDGRLLDANPAAEALVDAETGELVGRHLSDVLPELAEAVAGGEHSADLQLDQDGHVRFFDVRISELYRAGGAISGRLVSLRDVTDRRQREQRLDVLNRLLRHNLRNELNVVQGNAELLTDAVDDETARGRIDRIVDTVDTVIERANKVATLSRTIEDERVGALDLSAHLREVVATTRSRHAGATVEVDLPAELWVRAGPSLTVAFEELVDNAVEHAESDDPTVWLSVDEAASDDEFVVLSVADDGPGIEQQEWQAIARGRETPLSHGSGVGLWLVHWIVSRFGGSLSFDNTDSGSYVTVRVPRAVSPETAVDASA